MPWQERTVMAERAEFVAFAAQEGTNIAALCRHFGISRKTGYKWVARFLAGRELVDRSGRLRAQNMGSGGIGFLTAFASCLVGHGGLQVDRQG